MLSTINAAWATTLLKQAQIPKHVTSIFIMADKDRSKTEEKSAYKLAQRLLKERNNVTVKICLPPIDINKDKKSIDWQQNIAKYCQNNCRLAFAVSAAFAAPLLDIIGADSGGFNFLGSSSEGKSTALYVATSICGDKGYAHSWRANSRPT